MTIDKRILQVIDLNKNITMIETNPISYRKIELETLDYLKEKGITVEVRNGANELTFYTYKSDCFAFNNKQCMALIEIDCTNCKFYKNKEDYNYLKTEFDIKKYAKYHK